MTALDELREAIDDADRLVEEAAIAYESGHPHIARCALKDAISLRSAALARIEAELAELRTRPTLEQVMEALNAADISGLSGDARPLCIMQRSELCAAIRALYGEAKT